MIEVLNLTKVFGEQKAVNNISFEARKGEIVGFLGPNGAGKSTTMKIITGFTNATSGTVRICGETMHAENKKLKSKIGYLAELNPLYGDMYVKEYLNFIAEIYHIKSSEIPLRVNEVIEKTGLTVEKSKKIQQLSKGYKQRVGLAASLIHNPEVLILDEPTTGLDPNQIIEIRNLIKEVSKEKTVLLSSHIMQEIEALCDKIIIINKGELVANDNIEDLLLQNTENQNFAIVLSCKKAIDISDLKAQFDIVELQIISENKVIVISKKDIRQEIIKYTFDKNLELQEIKLEEQNVEDIFRKLTVT